MHVAPRLQTGTYTFTVISSATGQPAAAFNNPMSIAVFPAATAADASSFSVSAPVAAVGATSNVTLALRDRFGTPLTNSTLVLLNLLGERLLC